jgi:hypothetical protein
VLLLYAAAAAAACSSGIIVLSWHYLDLILTLSWHYLDIILTLSCIILTSLVKHAPLNDNSDLMTGRSQSRGSFTVKVGCRWGIGRPNNIVDVAGRRRTVYYQSCHTQYIEWQLSQRTTFCKLWAKGVSSRARIYDRPFRGILLSKPRTPNLAECSIRIWEFFPPPILLYQITTILYHCTTFIICCRLYILCHRWHNW